MVTIESETQEGYCQCGRPLHYSSRSIRRSVERMIELAGDQFVPITILGVGKFRVQRHFIALHGFSAKIAREYGFEEAK